MAFRGLGELIKDKPVHDDANLALKIGNTKGPYFGEVERHEFGTGVSEKDKLKELEQDRGKIYGDPFLSHQAIGLAWEGLFRNRYHLFDFTPEYANDFQVGKLFPADLVAEMLAAFKIVRLSRPIYHQDSADDAKVYIDFSQRFRGGKK